MLIENIICHDEGNAGTCDPHTHLKSAWWLRCCDRWMKLNIEWDRPTATRLEKRIVQSSCVYAEAPSSLWEVKCVWNPETKKQKRLKIIWINERSEFGEANHEVYYDWSGSKLDQPELNEFKTNIETHERSEWSAQPMNEEINLNTFKIALFAPLTKTSLISCWLWLPVLCLESW